MLGFDQLLRRRSAVPSASSRSRRGCRRRPLLGVAGQASLDLGVTLAQHAPALHHAGDPDLELLAPPQHLAAALLELAPGAERLGQVGQRPVELRLLGGDVGQPLLGLDDGGAGVLDLGGGQARLLLAARPTSAPASPAVPGALAACSAAARASRACDDAMRAWPARLGQLGCRGGLGCPPLRASSTATRDDPGAGAHAPARGGEAVAWG